MQKQLSRKRFLTLAALAPIAAMEACKTAKKPETMSAVTPTSSVVPASADKPSSVVPASADKPPAVASSPKPPKPPALPIELVREFVGKSHSDFARVKELYAQEPRLLNAVFDHGGGDFESGLEAAGHVGNKDIALFLLDKGARMNIFCAAMLGRLDIVKATLDAFPELKNSKGPHGLMLKHHAMKGGEEAKAVLAYLEKIGAS